MKTSTLILALTLNFVFASLAEAQEEATSVRDPIRVVNGINIAVGAGWVQFYGKVLEVQPKGVRLEGFYKGNGGVPDEDFFVENFPFQVAENDFVGGGAEKLFAIPAGVYTYKTAIGGSRTIHKLDYGAVYVPPPPTPEQIEAARKIAAAKKIADAKRATAGAELALKSNQDAAAAGDAYGLLRMGERYRDGEGVERDLAKAREYLAKAKDAGSPSAPSELDSLTGPK